MMKLQGGDKNSAASLAVYTQYYGVTDRQTDGHTSFVSIDYAVHRIAQ